MTSGSFVTSGRGALGHGISCFVSADLSVLGAPVFAVAAARVRWGLPVLKVSTFRVRWERSVFTVSTSIM